MLFNSYAFLFAFLPIAWAIVRLLRAASLDRAAVVALTLLSLVFYGWWNAVYLLLLVPLMLANFWIATRLVARRQRAGRAGRPLLVAGLAMNLAVLGYFKYANFFVDNVNALAGTRVVLAPIVLPLGISFFIFQKIAFLVDAYQGKLDEHLDLADYSLFVTFFPQLIAGPIVHHSEVLPQFRRLGRHIAEPASLALTIFIIGLAKKVLLADTLAPYAAGGFSAAAAGHIGLLQGWLAALSYTAQLYFDFSGYSDMAIGAALLFGVRLPVNFASPYKATSIIEFWRRWHITLSRFLRDYLYIPLGGNRHGEGRRQLNLFATMLLGGLWHGAGWTFVIWGALHGLYLAVNHAWRALPRARRTDRRRTAIGAGASWALTFLAIVVGWVFFRAPSLGAALSMLSAMAGRYGTGWPGTPGEAQDLVLGLALSVGFTVIALAAPNTQEIAGYTGPSGAYDTRVAPPPRREAWDPRPAWGLAAGAVFALCVLSLSRISEFLYFQF